MKMKNTFLIATSALLMGVFGAGRAFAAPADDTIKTKVRIESITKVAPDGEANLPLSPTTTSTIYFDVKLKDASGAGATVEFVANEYEQANSNNNDRPYLVLNIPLRGLSTKSKITLAEGEAASAQTAAAVAYYAGPGASADVLRFAYDVRPGDMSEAISWARKATGAPTFGGAIGAIRLSVRIPGTPQSLNGNLTEASLIGAPDVEVAEDTANVWPVSGYSIKIGALTDPADLNGESLYQGLVPVTISTSDGAAAANFSDTTLAKNCYLWVEAKDGADWKYVPAGVTRMIKDETAIVEGTHGTALSDTFKDAWAARFVGPNDPKATTFETQTYFVNIPASVPAGTTMRLCYGVRRDGGEAGTLTKTLYTYVETPLLASPVKDNANTSGYEVTCGEMTAEDFTLPADGLKLGYEALNNKVVSGGTINAGAGEVVTLVVSKINIDTLSNYGTLYADVECISATNPAKATFSRYYVPLDPTDTTGGDLLKLTIANTAQNGTSYFRIRIPQLEALGADTADKPFYLRVVSSPKRETINLAPGAEGTVGTEYYQPADVASTAAGSASFLSYTLTVPVSTSNRYFKIHPVGRDMSTYITPTATFADGRKVQETIARYVKLQTQGASVLQGAGAELVVSVPAGATSATFYVACINDAPQNYLTGTVDVDGTPVAMSGVMFIAKGCNSTGTITGVNDVCNGIVQPVVQDRAPTITASNPPSGGSTGTALTFTFTMVDVFSDYLVAKMSYGDGVTETYLYADEAEMIAIMGEAQWAAQLEQLAQNYGGEAADYAWNDDPALRGKYRRPRSAIGTETVNFSHTYTSGSNPSWIFTVTDSSMMSDSRQGQLSLQTSQLFTFYTVKNGTVPATGFVRWGNQSTAPGDVGFDWTFGETYTYNALTRAGGSTSVTVQAVPFAAGFATPADYTEISSTRDSFFYKWGARHADYEALLPQGDGIYERILTINRAFVSGGGEATDSTKWQDIVLEAVFVAEWLPGDALTAYAANRNQPYLYAFGDYNSDGVPDGWLLKNLGETNGRTAVEGDSIADTMPVEDRLPLAGWGSGDAAYRFGSSDGRLGYSNNGGPSSLTGDVFGYRLRIRGRDTALNAADGNGNWLSNPAWIVLLHPEQAAGVVCVGNVQNGVFTPEWNQVRLASSLNTSVAGVTVALTAENKIPYDANSVDAQGWAYVIDSNGRPIKAGSTGYRANNLMVQTKTDSDDYERFIYSYSKWGYKTNGNWGDDSVAGEDGALFPFTTVADANAAMDGKTVNQYTGADFQGTYCFIDARVPAGLLIDEPFYTDEAHRTDNHLDPRKTCWLDRFNKNNADQDGDGISNGAEYYFWYYASRIAWGSVYKEGDNVQLNTALWPAVDLRDRSGDNTDANLGTTEKFTLGRRYRNAYDPDAKEHAYYTISAGGVVTGAIGDASSGKGNYWETIPATEVLAAFDPYSAADKKLDTDNDGLTNLEEFAAGTNPIDCDTDNDWIIDGWEVAYGLDPLNIQDNGANDAEKNPDNDYYARAIVKLYPDYHHLFKVEVTTGAGTPFVDLTGSSYYFDYESRVFRIVSDAVFANGLVLGESVRTDEIPWETGKAHVTGWANEAPRFLEMAPEYKIIRDFEVYSTFGFNPETGWGTRTSALDAALKKFSGVTLSANTQPFVSREEFNSAVKRGNWKTLSTDPTSADTNGDGVPDGWEAYVGMRPYKTSDVADGNKDTDGDGLTVAQEFQCLGANLIGSGLGWSATLISDKHSSSWTNKTLPTDPMNPDTDFDGLWDGDEGDATYCYSPSIADWRGGGCNPTSADTDGDGMTDGWEFRYGVVASDVASEDDSSSTTTAAKVSTLIGPDPTYSGDYSVDYDRDGLAQYQEYLTGILRHLRYDLGPDAARIHKDFPGILEDAMETSSKTYQWKQLPDIYNAMTDMVNPSEAPALLYEEAARDSIGLIYDEIVVNPLAQAFSSSALAAEEMHSSQNAGGIQTEQCAPAITAAFNRQWAATIIFPTEAQLENYGLNVVPNDTVLLNDPAWTAYRTLPVLIKQIKALDTAWQRLLAFSPFVTKPSNPLVVSETFDQARAERQVRALIGRIDETLKTLRDNAAGLQPVVREMIAEGGETDLLWTARKNQILKALVDSFYNGEADQAKDPAFAGMAALTAGETAAYAGADATDYAAAFATEYSAYEQALLGVKSPLLKQSYRMALRGFNGGVSAEGLLAPIGAHMPLRIFEDRLGGGSKVFFGIPVATATTLGAYLPMCTQSRDPFMTTSPLVADSDADGMDDYWEVFHGLNPMLGDYVNGSSENGDSSDRNNYSIDRLQSIYALGDSFRDTDAATVYTALAPSGTNPFKNPALETGAVTGYDYYTYPWLAGVPFADPDGDGLLNFEEAVNPSSSDPAHYGTDPSPLWMTDPDNRSAFTARFYSLRNRNFARDTVYQAGTDEPTEVADAFLMGNGYLPAASLPYYHRTGDDTPATVYASVLPYEINEGYDTDGDGVPDMTELTTSSIFKGDPQTLRTPDRQQAAYFGGAGVMQSHVTTQFGPMALTTFTLECWVKPDADQPGADANGEVILIDRPWRFNDAAAEPGDLRHNFRLGLRQTVGGFLPFANYTGAGTTFADSTTVPKASPTVVSGEAIKAGEWNHIAVSYDGKRLVLLLNGVENTSVACSLIPANGVISVKNDGLDDVQRYTSRTAPLMIGAGPAESAWFSSLGNPKDDTPFTEYFANAYKGFIDEVRIWNGARTATQIFEKRRSTFTQAELLAFRVNVFNARRNGQGYYEPNTPAAPLAIYTFNDLLAGTRIAADETTGTPAYAANEPWERYPGQQVVGDATVPGSFTFRRKGIQQTRLDSGHPRITEETLPTDQELFTSYYTLTAAKTLRSKQYCENPGADEPFSEFVPLAHNTIDHLPVADVERSSAYFFRPLNTVKGSPELVMPSGTVSNLKVVDSVYWSPYAAGRTVSTTEAYDVKTNGNPYAYRYLGAQTFDADRYTTLGAYSTRYAADLLIYGDAFAKYDFESWENSPSTDPGASKPDPTTTVEEGDKWFDYASGTGDMLTDDQHSQGGDWLDKNIANGQTKDSDGDRMPNWWENYYGLDPEDATGDNGPHGDSDGDFLTNYAEYLAKSNPGKYSTVGNGVPDYHIPIWFRRGRPTFGLLYTDNDFMEDHIEAANRSERLSVDLHDGEVDADGDGWSNWAEIRAGFRSSEHSTNPNAATSIAQSGATVLEMPQPALRLTVDYFGDQNVYTNAVDGAKIIVHAYTAKNNNSAPDATFTLPLSTSTAAGNTSEQATATTEIGFWKQGKFSGYLNIGNVVPGSLDITYTRYTSNSSTSTTDGTTQTETETAVFHIYGDTATTGDVAELYSSVPATYTNAEGETVGTGTTRVKAGTINYRTGFYTLDFSDEDVWQVEGMTADVDATTGVLSNITPYNRTEFIGVASYKYGIVAGKSNTFTLVTPTSGYLKEGANNFFVFADLNNDGDWNDGEPAGIPDQHDVDVGFDLVNRPLHVALTEQAPPGSVRLDVKSILGVLLTENDNNSAVEGDNSSLTNPTTGQPLQPSKFASGLSYELILTPYENISTGETTTNAPTPVYRKQYNVKKPYLTEDEIFGNDPNGLPGTLAANQRAASYKVFLVPETYSEGSVDQWTDYNIAIVTNVFGSLDDASTALVSPIGGALRYNTELTFEWLCNIQVPTFTLAITKTADAMGNPVNVRVFEQTIRGVAPCATAIGNGSVEQYRYRYMLPRGLGELNADGTAVFGDGSYAYRLTLNPYNSGSAKTLNGNFRIQLNASGDVNLAENKDAVKTTSYNVQDSYYVRARVRYNGVLRNDEDFGGRRIRIEAHYSGSFNGDPVASVSDFLVHDGAVDADGNYTDSGETDAINRCVRMVKDKVSTRTRSVPQPDGSAVTETYNAFWSTRFDAEIRGLPTNDPVYLIAYFDLNGNGKRDAWEPWGYATQGLDAVGGYYFDPKPVTPVNTGKDFLIEFYIQDVDTDNDKLADSWEWLNSGKPTKDFASWCGTFTGTLANHHASDIWTTSVDGTLSLTAYGAQLFGLNVTSAPDANGAVKVEGMPEDLTAARELIDILGQDNALKLFSEGYASYGLTVKGIAFDGDAVTLAWDVTSATGVADGAVYDLTEVFAKSSSTAAVYAVYGKAALTDASWTKLGEVKVANLAAPSLTLTQTAITGADGEPKKAAFFKVILSAKTASAVTE